MLGRYTAVFDFAHRVPIAGSSRIPVRFHLWVSLAVAALAAVGVDRLARGESVRLRPAGLLVGLMVLGSIPILLYVYSPILGGDNRWTLPYHADRYRWLATELATATARTLGIGLGGVAAVVTAARTRSARVRFWACAAMPLVVMADLMGAHHEDVPTVTPAYWTNPPASARMLREDPSFQRLFGVAGISAGEPGYASQPTDFLPVRDTLDWSLPPVWGLSSSRGETPIISHRLLAYTDHVRVGGGRFNVESVSHFLFRKRPSARFEKTLGLGEPTLVGSALVYANPGVLPRVRLMGRPVYADNETQAIAAAERLGPEIHTRLVVEDPDRPLAPGATVEGSARIVRDEPERVEVEASCRTPAYLMLADTFDPGWSATVDGRPVPIRPADVAFRAVYLPSGEHRVVFRYRPAGFALGLAVSLAGAAVCALAVAWPRALPALRPAHDTLGWNERWPKWLWLGIAAVVAASAVGIGGDGRPTLSTRWAHSVHPFTWGAGIEAMGRPAP
jgi:hypothetical protein